MKEKDKEILEEVNDEIESALKDSRGLVSHQRRIAFVLSIGAVILIESYLEKLNVLKSGASIKHEWLKKKKENAKEFLSNQITCPIEEVKSLDEILDLAYKIEETRNQQAYGKNISEDIIKEKINLFFELKGKVENA